jgi:hypothetical protein
VEDDMEEVETFDVVSVIGPSPWHNSDTVAASFAFAANIASAAAEHFGQLAMLALGQSLDEWRESERQKFLNETEDEITRILNDPETGGTEA